MKTFFLCVMKLEQSPELTTFCLKKMLINVFHYCFCFSCIIIRKDKNIFSHYFLQVYLLHLKMSRLHFHLLEKGTETRKSTK